MSFVKSVVLSVEARAGPCGMGLGMATPCAFSGDSSVLRAQQRIHGEKSIMSSKGAGALQGCPR